MCVGNGCDDRVLIGDCESEEISVDRDLMIAALLSTRSHFRLGILLRKIAGVYNNVDMTKQHPESIPLHSFMFRKTKVPT